MWFGCVRFACRPVAILHANYHVVSEVVYLQGVTLLFSMQPTGAGFVNDPAFEFPAELRSFDR